MYLVLFVFDLYMYMYMYVYMYVVIREMLSFLIFYNLPIPPFFLRYFINILLPHILLARQIIKCGRGGTKSLA